MSVLRAVSILAVVLAGVCGAQSYFSKEWYIKELRALGEEPSPLQVATVTTYRFLWLRSFQHPIAVRVSLLQDGTGRLTIKEADAGKLIRNQQGILSKGSVREIVARANAIDFGERERTSGCDGARWMIEVSGAHGYKVVDAWSPLPPHPIHALGSLLLGVAGLKFSASDFY